MVFLCCPQIRIGDTAGCISTTKANAGSIHLADPAHAYATREEFLSFLYELYSRPDMLERFPDALKLLEDAQEVVP